MTGLTTCEILARTGVSTTTFHEWRTLRGFPAPIHGDHFDRYEVERWLEDNCAPSAPLLLAAPVACTLNANDNSPTVTRGTIKYPDKVFLDVLDGEWQSIPEVSRRLQDRGNKMSRNTVVARLFDLAAKWMIEADETGYKVRLFDEQHSPNIADPSPRAKVAQKSTRRPRIRKSPRITAANDDHADEEWEPESFYTPTLRKQCGLELMRSLPDRSVNLVVADLPYGSTGNTFDPKIDIHAWMKEMARVVKQDGAIVAFASLDFTYQLMHASKSIQPITGEMFMKERLVWAKNNVTGQMLLRHMQQHEDIIVFSHGGIGRNSKHPMTFNAQNVIPKAAVARDRASNHLNCKTSDKWLGSDYISNTNWPRSVLHYAKDSKGLHVFAKPVNLLEYLIRTYSNDNALILDPTMGSGSTGVAAINTGRRFIGAENGTDQKGHDIFKIAEDRIAATLNKDIA